MRSYFNDAFETVFAFSTDPTGTAADDPDAAPLVLYRAFPAQWQLIRKPPVGPPRTLLTSDSRPALDELRTAAGLTGAAAEA